MLPKWYFEILIALSILFFSAGTAVGQSTGTIVGTVTDSALERTIPGANIVLLGGQRGTTTDSEGNYELEVEPGTYDIQVSFVGYATETRRGVQVEANETTRVDFRLVEGVRLEEVVAVGYTQQRSEDVTGAVSTVSAGDVEDLPVTGVDQALQGQVSGVQVNQGSGVPGGGPQIRIRGAGSLGAGTEPLYVVDGFALPTSSGEVSNPINDIPPSNIESISVLKDASATAIYGSRGSNGVILIETKQGEAGDLRVNVNTYAGVQQSPSQMLPEFANAEEFARWRKQNITEQARIDGEEPNVPSAYQSPEQLGEGVDWPERVTRAASQYNFDLSVSGGNESVQSFFSAGYTNQEGLVVGTDYERFSLRANVDATISEMFSAGLRLAPTFTRRNQAAVGGGGRYEQGLGFALVASPIDPAVDENGNFTGELEPLRNQDGSFNAMYPDLEDSQAMGSIFPYPNPLQTLEQVRRDRQSFRALGSVYGEFQPIDELRLRSTFNADWQDDQARNFDPSTLGQLFVAPPTNPSGVFQRGGYLNWLTETTLTYTDTYNEIHSLEAIAGLTAQEQDNIAANFSGQRFPGNEVQTLNTASEVSGETGASEWSLLSLLGRLDYSYDGRYLLTATVRRDGSSRFGSNNQWGTFPSLALGWRLSEEAFLEDLDDLSNLKLRVSFGRNGNFNIGNYAYTGEVGLENYVSGGGLINGRTVNTLANPNLGWEQSTEFNLGLEVGLFDSRITTSIDLYRRDTESLLLDVEVPQSSGFSNVTQNRGEIRNQGIEVAISSRNIERENFSWQTSVNFASNGNEVLSLGPDDEPIIAGNVNAGRPTHITQVGGPIGQFYGWRIEGLYNSEEEISENPSYDGAIVGNIRPIDTGGDGSLDRGDDFTAIGNPYPDFTFGINNQIRYRNFDLRVLATGSYGGKRMRAANEYLWNIDGVFNVPIEYIEGRYRSPEDPGDGVTPTAVGPADNRLIYRDPNTLWVQDNSHLWIKNITLGYTIPSSVVGRLTQRARVYGSVQNAFLLTAYDGGNPQATNYRSGTAGGPAPPNEVSQQLTPGLDFSTYPVPRTITLGVQLNF